MKLLYVFTAILAFSCAETEKREIPDSEAAASVEILKEAPDLKAEASAYNAYVPPSQKSSLWTSPTYVPPAIWNPPQEPIYNWNPPKNPVSSWTPPKQPVNSWVKPVNTWVPPVQNDYVHQHPVQNTWTTPHYTTTTTPSAVIKNEQYYYDNGAYKYEYQIADGTHVGEEGYFTDPKHDDESLVKKGWYSFVGADGKTYTVTYWADKTGFHAYGDHLPTPPPVPAAIQAALDKEEAEKQKPQYTTPAPVYYPTQAPTYYPTQAPTYYPTQAPTYYPTKKPIYIPPQHPTYYPQQPTYYPPHHPTYPTYSK